MPTRTRPVAPTARADGHPPAPVVEMEEVRRSFGSTTGLDGLTMRVAAGSVTVLVGPNGAGKTTALRVMTGALPVEAGQARVLGVDPAGPHGGDVRRRCGVVAAKPALYDRLTGRDNLRFAADIYGLGDRAPVDEAAARFGIRESLDLAVGGYSTGMKTRLALARAVLHEPSLLLLDEPTSGLDPESSHAVLELIDSMAAGGTTVVMCTHLLLEAEGLADEVVLMQEGTALVTGPPADLVRRYWPRLVVVVGTVGGAGLDRIAGLAGVVSVDRRGPEEVAVQIDDDTRIPEVVADLVAAGARISRVVPHQPSLEDLYLRARGR